MRFRQFLHIEPEFIIDIGANIGIATVYMKTLFPKAKIISIEPDVQNFECLKKNTFFIQDIELENRAFGYAKNYNLLSRPVHRQVDIYAEECNNGGVPGITMEEIFSKYNIKSSSRYFIKSDCEGAERYFIDQGFCENAVQNAIVFFMEVHFNSVSTPMFKTTWETYNTWIRKFSNTHQVEYFTSSKSRGYGHYLLSKK